jgi:long-chain acyl-CoA synthetase
VLALLPFAHLFGLTVTGSAPLLVGARVTTMDRFNPVPAAELLATDITEVVGVPAIFHALLAAITRRGVRLQDGMLRVAICGGAVLPRELQDRWADATGVELREGYGLTEAGPVCVFNRVDTPNVRGALGVPYPKVDVAICAPASHAHEGDTPDVAVQVRADGMPGEICVRGPNVFRGYLGTGRGLPRRGEWLCTGDEGVRDMDGTFRFLGLLKPMFTRNGFNVYPREIERVVSEMPGVAGCEVAALPDPLKEHEILLRVTGSVHEEDVKRWCEARLSAYKQPSVIEIRSQP